jgi:catechol 2,3-dioxygenase-like lactoylglutathione lyase family enzyme
MQHIEAAGVRGIAQSLTQRTTRIAMKSTPSSSTRTTLKHVSLTAAACFAIVAIAGWTRSEDPKPAATTKPAEQEKGTTMKLGTFSISLAVKNLPASRAFYEKLGFKSFGGDGKKWLMLQNETTTIGLFEGMFDKNILTFNPGWDHKAQTLPQFDDVREIQKQLKAGGIIPVKPADENGTGPDSFVIVDPDGNQILFDQHVPKGGK